ncbi:hypothetical protein B9Z55_026877 [Caenorhabditis nigoni]|uniref:DUF281 domain-containing protein n=1 Tax=Caenorhabditis nigoni TaxID=1611254 RepID=A0A2G5SIE8_9PELO|nr:hypothetical protein B9Z55_026877 [Caenorhabditis nigoni]
MHPIGILLCVLVSIGYCTDTDDSPVVNVAFYCPKNKTWGYDIKVYVTISDKRVPMDCNYKSDSLDTTFTFKCITAGGGLMVIKTYVLITIEHSCTKNGDVQKIEIGSEDASLKKPAFVAWNLDGKEHAAAYEKLFVPYMKEECGKDDCGRVRKLIQDSCDRKDYLKNNIKKQCHDGIVKALRVYCNSDGGGNRHTICTEYVTSTTISTTPTTSTSTTTKRPESSIWVPAVIGASVATIVLIGGLIVCLKCRQSKKNQVSDPYGATTKSKTKRSTTGSGTTTGESKKSTSGKKKKGKKGKRGKKNKKNKTGTTTGTKTGKKTGRKSGTDFI